MAGNRRKRFLTGICSQATTGQESDGPNQDHTMMASDDSSVRKVQKLTPEGQVDLGGF